MREIVKICPVCGLSIDEGDITKVCPSCGVTHHITCWDRNNGCSTFACPEGPKPLVARPGFVLCPSCGTECVAGKKFCSKCGGRLEIPAPTPAPDLAAAFGVGVATQPIFDPNICSNCGTPGVAGKKFCPRCGNKLSVPQPIEQMGQTVAATVNANVCKTCGAPLKEGNKFCTKCGTFVDVPPAVEQVAQTIDPNVCKTCGAPLIEGNNFCIKCGTPRS